MTFYYTIWRRPDAKHIAWASTVIYKAPPEGTFNAKPTYFSAKEMKVSKAPSKQYDKRFEEVRDVHDSQHVLTARRSLGSGIILVS